MTINKLEAWDLDCGKNRYGDGDMENIKITESNITRIVAKLNEVVDWINSKNDQLL